MVEITEEDFREYVRVQRSGVTNMLFTSRVAELSQLSEEQVKEIIDNYDHYMEEYPEVRE